MKKIFLTLILISLIAFGYAQKDITLCHTPATEKFAMFASNKNFNEEHARPRPYVHISQAGGKMLTFKCKDGTDANGYVIMAKQKTDNWLFVFQEWWGLNDYIKKQSESLYNDLGNVNILALDMYDGKVTGDRDAAAKYMQAFKQERGNAIVEGALAYVGSTAKIGTIGWCFGGGQSLQAALTAGKQAAACVMYYGMPEEDVNRLKNLNCDVLDVWAAKDKFITKEVTDKFEANMKAAGKQVTVKVYDEAHGFANPSNPIYSESSTKDAYNTALAFLKARLK